MVFGIENSDWIFSKGAVTQAYFAGGDGNLWMRWAGDWLSNLLAARLSLSGGTVNGNITVYGNYATSGEIYTGYQFKCGSGSDTPYLNNPYGADHFRAAGTAWFTYTAIGSTNFFSTSRRAVKTMINDFQKNAVSLIESINIVEFRYKNDLNNKRIGFIAEDTIEEVATKSHDQMDINSSIGLLFKAIQELSSENKILKEELQTLKTL
jgi:hypothetical protein